MSGSQCEPEPLLYVGVIPENTVAGDEVLVTIWPDGTAEIATRPSVVRSTWSAPSEMRKADG